MRLRAFNMDTDFEDMKNWINDERSHALWCANIIRYPLNKDHLDEGLKEADKRIQVITQANLGAGPARNAGQHVR